MRRTIALVDEIWAGSRFVTDAFAAVADVPVHAVPIPVAEPRPPIAVAADFPGSPTRRRPSSSSLFDHFSITERKNPIGVDHRLPAGVRTRRGAGAGGQDDERGPALGATTSACSPPPTAATTSVVWDERLARADQMALVAAADAWCPCTALRASACTSPRRCGWARRRSPRATSGNLDFMDDECSLLIDAEMVNVRNGQGIDPPEALWAEPGPRPGCGGHAPAGQRLGARARPPTRWPG